MTFFNDTEAWVRVATFLPIVICSIVGCGLTIAKWLDLRQPDVPSDATLADIRTALRAGDQQAIVAITCEDKTRGARLIEQLAALPAGSRARLQERAARLHRQLVDQMEHGLGAMALIATLGPLLGLLGTVVGIVLVFNRLAVSGGVATPQQLAGGIGTALYTTIAGLVVGVVGLVAHRYLTAKVDRVLTRLDALSQELVDLLCEAEA